MFRYSDRFKLFVITCLLVNFVIISSALDDPGADSPYRLPLNNANPHLLKLTLKLDLSDMSVEKIPYEGYLTYNMYLEEPLQTLSFNYHEIDVDWWNHTMNEITDEPRDPIVYNPVNVTERPVNQITDIVYDKELQIGRHFGIFSFSGTVRTDQTGLYRSNYTVDGVVKHLITTQLEPAYARSIFPAFDEPRFRLWTDVTISHNNPNYHVISNMPIYNITTEDGYTTTRFERTVKMPLYLLAILISEYEPQESNDSRVNTYVPVHLKDQARYSVEFGEKSLSYLESYLNSSYQLPKIDFAAIPHFTFGAMENWGLVTYRTPVILYDQEMPTKTLVNNIQSQALLITHELTHMWFGNEVTPYYWHYVWLSEGFARYFEYMATDQLETSWKLKEQFVVRNVQAALAEDDRLGVRSMSGYIDEPAKIANMFNYVVYAKSSSIIKMLHSVIGETAFRNAIINYISNQSFNYTVPDALYSHLQDEVNNVEGLELPASIAEIFDSWADFEGYPIVTVTRNYSTEEVTFSQTRFLIRPEERPLGNVASKYFIPVSYSDLWSEERLVWLTDTEPSVAVKYSTKENFFVMANLHQNGFYRVNYDERNWQLIITQLHSSAGLISVENRAQLIDDAGNLAYAGLLDYDKVFRILSYLANEDEYVPWLAASRTLSQLERLLRGTNNYKLIERFLVNITTNIYKNKLTVLDYNNTDHVIRMHRLTALEWACKFGSKECLEDVDTALDLIIDNYEEEIGKPFIPYEIRPQIFCAAAKYSDSENRFSVKLYDYLRLIAEGRSVTDKQLDEARRVIAGLGCSPDENFLKQFLQMSLNVLAPGYEYLRAERSSIFNAVAQSSYAGTKVAIDFIKDNYSGMKVQYDAVHTVFNTVANYINTKELLDKLLDIMDFHFSRFDDASQLALELAILKGEETISWLNQHSEAIDDWLVENFGTPDDDDDGSTTIAVSISLQILSGIFLIIYW